MDIRLLNGKGRIPESRGNRGRSGEMNARECPCDECRECLGWIHVKRHDGVWIDPDEVYAIGRWLKLVVRDSPGTRLCIYPHGKLKEVSLQHAVNILYSASNEIASYRARGDGGAR